MKKQYKVEMIKEFNQEFLDYWGFAMNDSIKVGWITWINHPLSLFEGFIPTDSEGYNEPRIHPEENKYGINFPISCFKQID